MDRPAVIETRDLVKAYGPHAAVDRLTMQVFAGEIFGFLGPNGSGKTTTLMMLLGLTEPTSGAVRVCGMDPTRDAVAVKRRVAFLPESLGFYEDMTGGEFPDDLSNDACALGKRLVESCENKVVLPEAEAAQAEFKERMQMLVQFRKEEWPYEYEYWQEHYGME